jgi:hypothetical protein
MSRGLPQGKSFTVLDINFLKTWGFFPVRYVTLTIKGRSKYPLSEWDMSRETGRINIKNLDEIAPERVTAVLRRLLEDVEPSMQVQDRALYEAGVIAASLLKRIDYTPDEPEDIVSDLQADTAIPSELADVLRRLIDRQAPDRIRTASLALELL